MLTLDNINKTYEVKKGPSVRALCDVSLSFSDTGLVFILGKSGSGKTTLLNIMGGLDRPDSGKILFRDRDLLSSSSKDLESYRRDDVGFVFQDYNLIPELSVGENVSLSLELIGDAVERKEKVEKALESVGLKGFYGRMPSELSGGQRQRVAISRAIVKSPSPILADEPTGALDSKTGEDLLSLLKSLSLSRLVIVVSHDRDLADKYADRIIEIADSKVLRDSLSDVPERREVKVADSKKSGGLSFRSRLRLAFSFMKVRKWRMVLTIIVCSIAMCLFGLSFSFADYSREDVLKESLIYSDEPFVSLTQKDRKSNHTVTGLNDKGIERINDQTGFGFQGYLPLSTSFDSLLPYKHQGVSLDYSIPSGYEKAFYAESADKVSYLNENDLQNGYSLVCGNLPKKNDEIILTDYQVNSFKHYGIYYENKDEYIKSADFKTESLLNEKLNGFTITGILDTGFKETDYPESMIIISDPEKNSSYDYSDDDFLHSLSTSFRNCVFVSEENYHQYFDKESGFVFPGGSVISSDNKIQSPYYFRRFHSEYKGYVLFDDEAFSGDEVMVDYETLLSDSSLPRPFSIDEGDILDSALRASYSSIECEPRQFVNNSLSQLIVSNVVIKNYKTFDVDDNEDYLIYIDKNSYEGIEEDEKKKLAFSSFIADLINDSDNQSFFYLTPIQRQYLSSYDDAKKEILSKYLVKYRLILFPESDLQFTIQDNGYNSLFDLKEKVAGIDIGLGLNISKRGKVVATEDIISKTGNYEEMYYSQAISPNSHKRDEFSALLTMIDGQTGLYSLSLVGNMIEKINMVSASTSTLSTIFIWVSVSLSVFSVVLLGSYIASSAEEKEKTIGILRSMGSSSREVYSLVLIEGFLLTIMSIVLSIILLYLVSFIMNLHLSNSLGFTIMIIIPKIKEIVILFAMGLAVSFLSSFMPIINISKKSPLDYVHSL